MNLIPCTRYWYVVFFAGTFPARWRADAGSQTIIAATTPRLVHASLIASCVIIVGSTLPALPVDFRRNLLTRTHQ